MIKKYGPYVVLLAIIFFLANSTYVLEEKNKQLESEAVFYDLKAKEQISKYEVLKSKDSALQASYDSLKKTRSNIKIKYNERIKIINMYSVSDMQHFFDERTGKGCSTR
jgi:hypothetical protein